MMSATISATGSSSGKSVQELKQRIIGLGPWHHRVQVTPEVNTALSLEAPPEKYKEFGPVVMVDDHDAFHAMIKAVYPQGVQGKSLIEAACNCGVYSLWFKKMGGARVLGFDAREHWINQARFLKEVVLDNDENLNYEVCGLDELPSLNQQPFDVGMFKGIFYHLPDPIGGLRIVADLTKELLIFNTGTRWNSRPGLVMAKERVAHVMSGVHGLNWFPTSPEVCIEILRSMGFKEFRVLFWHKRPSLSIGTKRGWIRYLKNLMLGTGRLGLLAARTPGFFNDFDRSGFDGNYKWC